MIYLDNAATTFPKPESVYLAMDEVNRKMCVNAGRGAYKIAQEASSLIQETKNHLRNLIHADLSMQVVFTPSITIALNQIINGINWKKGSTIYVSPYEHNAVARTLHKISKEFDLKIRILPIKLDSLEIDIEKIKYEFSQEKPFAVFCTHVSNVTGYILPIAKIFEEGKKYKAITVLDSAQSLGLIKLDVKQINADIIAFAGHKTLYGPFGVGGFVNVSNISLKEYIVGGTGSDSLNLDMPQSSESKFEASSQNIVAIAGLNAALKSVNEDASLKHEKELSEYLIKKLSRIKKIQMYLPKELTNHVGIVSFTYQGMASEDVGTILDDDYDIAVRTGYHCAPYIHEFLKDKSSLGTVRIGLSQFNSREDIDKLVNALEEIDE